jgi:hypothetical protein
MDPQSSLADQLKPSEKELYDKLQEASVNKDLVEMERLLKAGVDPNLPASIDFPLLYVVMMDTNAKEEDVIDVVTLLLKYKADVTGRYFEYGCRRDTIVTIVSGCMKICQNSNSWKLLELFLKHGEDPNRLLKDLYDGRKDTITISWNYLHDAIKLYKSYEMTEILLRNGANANSIYKYRADRKEEKLTPLHLALEIGSIKLPSAIVNELIFSFYLSCRRMLVIDIYNLIFEKLSQLGDHLLIRTLLEHGADVNQYSTISEGHGVCVKSFTPIHIAIQKNDVYAVKAFLTNGADLELPYKNHPHEQTTYDLAKSACDEISSLIVLPKVVIPKKAERGGPVPNLSKK